MILLITLSDFGSYASVGGLIISFATFIFATILNKEIKKLKSNELFEKTINWDLEKINSLQNKLVTYIYSNPLANETEIKLILSEQLSIFQNLLNKLADKKILKYNKSIIRELEGCLIYSYYIQEDNNLHNKLKSFYRVLFLKKANIQLVKNIYIKVNAQYFRINQLRLNNKATYDSGR